MSDFFERRSDPTDALLSSASTPAGDVFRQSVLVRTTAVLRQRRRLRRLARLAALAACYVAGLMTMHGPRPVARPDPEPVDASATLPAAPSSALALEWEALDHPDRGTTLFRAAGDRYLADQADVQAAVRCYGNALDDGSAEDLTIESTDSWLLIAIKDARQREKSDAIRVE
jgi:hypothetical protein